MVLIYIIKVLEIYFLLILFGYFYVFKYKVNEWFFKIYMVFDLIFM